MEQGRAVEKLPAKYELGATFTLHALPMRVAAPKRLEAGAIFDLVFIDGMHCFEYKSLDEFFGDRLLRLGGYLVFHDAVFPSTRKVLRLLKITGRYVLEQTP